MNNKETELSQEAIELLKKTSCGLNYSTDGKEYQLAKFKIDKNNEMELTAIEEIGGLYTAYSIKKEELLQNAIYEKASTEALLKMKELINDELKKRGRKTKKTKADLLYELKTIFFILNQYLNQDERIDKEADVDFYIWEMQRWLRENKYLQL